MRFLHLSLTNYIGIYHGLRLTNIAIDFSKCKHRTIVIKGDNGSGKSTIMNALNIFPDDNNCFIPNQIAKKEIVLEDGNIMYKLVFVHGVKSNGERDTTKAYISRMVDRVITELNPNGNVTSYKNIVYDELALDPNFSALSQLSLEDRGLADKKPAERKKFVNSIIENLEVYNNMYKTLTKKSSVYKNLINGIVAKLNMLGDPNVLKTNLDALELLYNEKLDQKDKVLVSLAQYKSTIDLLDPDGSIQAQYTEITTQKQQVILRRDKLQNLLDSETSILFDRSLITDETIISYDKRIMNLENTIQKIDDDIKKSMIDTEEEARHLMAKTQRYRMITNDSNYDDMIYRYSNYIDKIEHIKEDIQVTGITLGSITKAEYIIALETLKEIGEEIDKLKDSTDYYILETVIQDYVNQLVDPAIGYTFKSLLDPSIGTELANIEKEIIQISQSLEVAKKLSNRPNKCKIDNCFFIKDAVDFMKTNPENRLNELEQRRIEIENLIEQDNQTKELYSKKQTAIRYIYSIIRGIEKNGDVLHKIGIFDSPTDLLDGILRGKSFEYMKTIYRYIDLGNLFDEYNHINSLAISLKSEIDLLDSKKDIIDNLLEEIEEIKTKIDRLDKQTARYRYIKSMFEVELESDRSIQKKNIEYNRIIKEIDKYDSMIIDYDKELKSIEDKTSKISECINKIAECKSTIQQLTSEITPILSDRDKLVHNIQLVEDYNKELEILNGEYSFLEKIKYYTSPTTGIQLVFMELYMGKILYVSNELLSLLFNGRYQIQPFIIDETEFRIPCMGDGLLNDDISSMSSAQIAMISMILSFSLLYQSSTKYNIIKLDEIDGPLDENNRIMIITVLDKIMDIMGSEQCIMISHNTELQLENCDIILLKTSIGSSDYTNGNIIWKYQ